MAQARGEGTGLSKHREEAKSQERWFRGGRGGNTDCPNHTTTLSNAEDTQMQKRIPAMARAQSDVFVRETLIGI